MTDEQRDWCDLVQLVIKMSDNFFEISSWRVVSADVERMGIRAPKTYNADLSSDEWHKFRPVHSQSRRNDQNYDRLQSAHVHMKRHHAQKMQQDISSSTNGFVLPESEETIVGSGNCLKPF